MAGLDLLRLRVVEEGEEGGGEPVVGAGVGLGNANLLRIYIPHWPQLLEHTANIYSNASQGEYIQNAHWRILYHNTIKSYS